MSEFIFVAIEAAFENMSDLLSCINYTVWCLCAPQGGHGSQRRQHHSCTERVAHLHAEILPLRRVEADGPAYVSQDHF